MEDLQELIDKIDDKEQQFGLSINVEKTKIMIISREEKSDANILINSEPVQRVKEFKYLGAFITEDLNPEIEIKKIG